MSATNSRVDRLRLCITGSFGFQDIGDEAMLTEALAFLLGEMKIPRTQITLFGHQPEYVSVYHEHPRECCVSSQALIHLAESYTLSLKGKFRRTVKRFLRGVEHPEMELASKALENCSAALVTGGGTINTRDTSGSSLCRMHSLVSSFSRHGKPLFISGQTIGPLGVDPRHDELAREIVANADVLTVRDGYYSRRYLEVLGVTPKEFLETLDDAATLPCAGALLPESVDAFLNRRPTIAFNVTEYTSNTYEKRSFLASVCEWLLRSGDSQLLFLSHAPRDYAVLFVILDMLPSDLRSRILVPDTRNWRADQLKSAIAQCRLAFGGRYHFIVFAATSGTPFVGHCGNHYSYIKQDGFARMVGFDRFILNERESWDRELVLTRLTEAQQNSFKMKGQFSRPGQSMRRLGEWLVAVAAGSNG